MKHIFIMTAVLLLAAGCRQAQTGQPGGVTSLFQPVTDIPLSENSTLQLFRSSDSLNFITLCLMQSDGAVDECMALGNADYCTTDAGDIVFDTVSFAVGIPAYILRTYDISSTYGAETWYVLSPRYDFDPKGFYRIDRIPFDMLSVQDVNRDGVDEIVAYPDPRHSDSTVYAFHQGIFTPVAVTRQ